MGVPPLGCAVLPVKKIEMRSAVLDTEAGLELDLHTKLGLHVGGGFESHDLTCDFVAHIEIDRRLRRDGRCTPPTGEWVIRVGRRSKDLDHCNLCVRWYGGRREEREYNDGGKTHHNVHRPAAQRIGAQLPACENLPQRHQSRQARLYQI